jgi:hypothetical protein
MKGGNIKLAVIAQEVYEEPNKRKDRDGWKYVSGDKRQGIWEKDGKAVVGIRGTDFKDAKDLADDVAIGIGVLKLTPRYKQAKKWVKKAIEKYGKNNVEVAGHSLGAKISKELAKDFGIRGSTFNAGASVSDAASSVLDRTACKVNKKGRRCKRAKLVQNYRTATDPISAASVGDINMNTVKRKSGKDPHAIANFVEEQEGEEGASDEVEKQSGGYYGMRGRGMCGYGYGSKRYDFTHSGTGRRRRMKKTKNMVEATPPPPPPQKKKKVLSQKEYCSLYRC